MHVKGHEASPTVSLPRLCYMPYHMISYPILSYCIVSYHITSYHTIPYHVMSYHIIYHISWLDLTDTRQTSMWEYKAEVGLPKCRQRPAGCWRPAQSWRRAGAVTVPDGACFFKIWMVSVCTISADRGFHSSIVGGKKENLYGSLWDLRVLYL